MLPSTSSPVEAAPTPISPSGPFPCQPQYVGQSREGGARDEYLPPSPAALGMCGSEESGQEGRVAKPPPDLCSRDKANPFRTQSVEGAVGGPAIAQGACDYKHALNDSHCRGEERGGIMEEGACSLPPQSCKGEVPHCPEEDMKCTTKAGLPDLCDTGSGARSKVNYQMSGRSASPSEAVQYESPSKGGVGSGGSNGDGEGVGEGSCSFENTQKSEREKVDVSHSKGSDMRLDSSKPTSDVAQGDGSEGESRMEEEVPVTVDSVDGSGIAIKPEESHEHNTENAGDSVCGGDVIARGEVVCEDSNIDMKESEDAEMMAGPLESYLIHDNQQISLVACGITQCDPSFQYDMAVAEPVETEDGMSLIKYNLHHSSHPMYEKWPCYFYITEEHLPSFTIDSHGRHIGSVRQHSSLCSLIKIPSRFLFIVFIL